MVQKTQNSDTPGVPASGLLFESALQHLQADRLSDALELFQQVLEVDPKHADSLFHLGTIALKIGHTNDAIDLIRQTIALVEDHVEAHRTLADALATTGQLVEAEKHYERVLALKPDAMTFANLATVYMVGGNPGLALRAAVRGLKISELPKLKSLFVRCLQHARSISLDGDLRTYLVRALSEPWQRPGDLAHVSVAILKHDPRIGEAMTRAVARWPERASLEELYGQAGLAAASSNQLLRALLENTQFANIPLERLLTLTRSALLEAAMTGSESMQADHDPLGLFCALAQQCFLNEYAFACSADECQNVDTLGGRITKMAGTGETITPLAVAAFAAYRPLHTLACSDALLGMTWPAPLQDLLRQQIQEPAAQHALRGAIPQFTPIDDTISALVRDMYEENPYPRWVKTASDPVLRTIDRQIQSQHPGAPYQALEKDEVEVLIAGCGTGQQVAELASSNPDARITAVDLSLSSLSYAKHRTDSLGLNNITYGQADILELSSLGRSFDLILCTGVLHHMGDPLRGWRVLLSLLKPKGLMKIALYSETARADIVAAREFIAQGNYGSAAEDIRRLRQDLLSLEDSNPAKRVTGSGDFFGTSTCRDLLFHVQEQRFTIPQIKAFIDQNALQFLGFLIPPQHRRSYVALFPDDPAGINLDNWHEFERQNPAFFLGMYQFHVQKGP